MPGPADLMALLQGGGGGGGAPPMPPQGPPQGGGGVPPGALIQKLQELMQDPVAMKGMLQHAQSSGMIPGGAPPGAGGPPPGMPPGMAPPGMEAPPGAPPPQGDGAEAMAADAIDSAGGWEGTDAPSKTDIDRLTSDPSPENIKSFNEQFGDGAAEEVLQGAEGPEEDAKAPPEEAEAAEY